MTNTSTWITLTRDCDATMIPYGDRVALTEGGEVQVVQQLGGSITVRTPMGALLRIDGVDADAVGIELADDAPASQSDGEFAIGHVVDALQTVFDPEIPISIVELGLVYRCDEVTRPDGSRLIEIDMSMTAPGCGMGDVLRADAARVVGAVPGVDGVDVSLVWDPPWTMHRMSEAARLELGML
ncbi:MAG: putative Fe-S cluster assembly protein SufT [Acidimicrobiia bacterium]|nr:putative Fe-S cluster assembly protein SufT [Acidimicrobiia bacterium]